MICPFRIDTRTEVTRREDGTIVKKRSQSWPSCLYTQCPWCVETKEGDVTRYGCKRCEVNSNERSGNTSDSDTL